MKRNLLYALQTNTSPISESDLKKFLVDRHGITGRENASSDSSALDATGLEHLKVNKKTEVKKYVLRAGPIRRRAEVIKVIKVLRNETNRGDVELFKARKQTKKNFGF